MIQACNGANLSEFIASLPQGYDTECGSKGVALSGGQKQRVAIARALIRDPEVLILDEATSALDTESAEMVRQALQNAQRGRTTIVVTHRLDTVRNADLIVVMAKGRVVEQGTHGELMRKEGAYWRMYMSSLGGEGV